MRISVPQYIYDYARWSEEPSNQNRRTLMLPSPNPDSNIESYTWGYWSLAPITTLLINNQNLNYNFYMGNQEKASLKKVYQLMERNDPKWIQLARFLQIDTLVLRKDFDWQLKNSGTANPELYRHTLTQTPGINQIKNFGNWDVFEISDHQSQKITQHNSLAVFVGADLQDSVEAPIFDPTQPIYKLGDTKNLDTDLIARADTYYLKPECLMCDAQWHFVNIDLYIPLFTRGSFLYPLFPNKVQPYQDPSRRLEYLSELSLEKILAYRKARDQKENGDVLITTLVDHEKALGSLMGEMEHVLSQATFDNNQLNSISSILRTERIILIDQINTLTKDTAGTLADKIFKQLYQNYQLLEKVQNQTDGHAWRSMQSDQKRFLLSVPSPGEYQIIYQPNSDQFRISDPLTIELNDQVHTVTPSVIPSASWYSLGSIQLGTGASRLEISQPQYNLVDPEQTSFERTSSYAGSCFISDKIAAQNQEIFRISFNHQRVAGNKDFFAGILLSESEIHPFLATDSLRISSYPSTYSKDYAVNKDSEFVLIICDRPENTQDGAKTSIAISDLVIQKLNTPEMLLYKTHRQLAKSPPELKLQKDDNTSYQTTISALDQPSITVLHETASPQWELSGIKSELFKINGYANGWVTQSQTTADITIKYQLESLLRIGFMISGAAFFILVIFLAVSHRPYANKN